VAAAIPEEARRRIAEFKRESVLRRHGLSPPAATGLDPAAATSPLPAAEASPRAGPQVAGEAPADQESAAGAVDRPPVIPVQDPANVSFPSDDLGAVAGPCVVCQRACPSIHNESGQVRHAACHDPPRKDAAA
jgi:hypothetical protein